MADKFCMACGAPVQSPTHKFCVACGAPVNRTMESDPSVAAPTVEFEFVQEPVPDPSGELALDAGPEADFGGGDEA